MTVERIKESFPVSRGKVRCSCCLSAIPKGTKYSRSTNIFDGRIYDFLTCAECERIFPDVWQWWSLSYDEGIGSDEFDEWASENQDKPGAQEYLRRRKQGA